VLITDAKESSAAEFDRRRKRYALMMAARVVCVIGAGLLYQVSLWVALALVVGGAVLPWCAVIIANDGPVKKRAKQLPYVAAPLERTLPSRDDGKTIEG
jgi:Flp pilus assembly protein TadB